MHRLTRNPADIQQIEGMVTKGPLIVPSPDEMPGFISEKDIKDLAKRDRKTVLALSVIEQWSNWQTQTLIDQDTIIRLLDAKLASKIIELEQIKDKQKEEGRNWGIVKWLAATILAAILAALISWAIGKP